MVGNGLRIRRTKIRILDVDDRELIVAQDIAERDVRGNVKIQNWIEGWKGVEQLVDDGIRVGRRQEDDGPALFQGFVRRANVEKRIRDMLDRAAEDHGIEKVLLGQNRFVEVDAALSRDLDRSRIDLHAEARAVPLNGVEKFPGGAADVAHRSG